MSRVEQCKEVWGAFELTYSKGSNVTELRPCHVDADILLNLSILSVVPPQQTSPAPFNRGRSSPLYMLVDDGNAICDDCQLLG